MDLSGRDYLQKIAEAGMPHNDWVSVSPREFEFTDCRGEEPAEYARERARFVDITVHGNLHHLRETLYGAGLLTIGNTSLREGSAIEHDTNIPLLEQIGSFSNGICTTLSFVDQNELF